MPLTLPSFKSVIVGHDQKRSVDSTKEVTISWALWLPLIWLFLVSTRSVSGWLRLGEPLERGKFRDISGGSSEDQVVLFTLLLLGIAILANRRKYLSGLIGANKWIVALFAYMLMSVAWSNFPELSWRRWIRSSGALVMVLVVLTEENPLESILALLRRCYCIHLPFSIIAIKYIRNIGVDYGYDGSEEMWIGFTPHKNNLGQVAMSAGVVFFWSLLRNKSKGSVLLDVSCLLMALWLLIGSGASYSSTARVGFLLGVALLLGLLYVKRNPGLAWRYAKVGLLLFGIVAGVIGVGAGFQDQSSLMSFALEAMGRDATLTGRTGLWADILENASKNPLFGVGFGAFWVGPVGYDLYPLPNWSTVTPEWRPNEGHNGYLDAYVEVGMVGLCLTLGGILAAFRNIRYAMAIDFEYARIRAVFMFILLVNNITESSLLKGTHSLWFLLLLFAINSSSKSSVLLAQRPRQSAV